MGLNTPMVEEPSVKTKLLVGVALGAGGGVVELGPGGGSGLDVEGGGGVEEEEKGGGVVVGGGGGRVVVVVAGG